MKIEVQGEQKWVEVRHLKLGDMFRDPRVEGVHTMEGIHTMKVGVRTTPGSGYQIVHPEVPVVFFPGCELVVYEGASLTRQVELITSPVVLVPEVDDE